MALKQVLSLFWHGKSAPTALTSGRGLQLPHPFTDIFNKNRAPTPIELIREAVNTVYACMMLNADLIASTPLRLYVTTRRGDSRSKMSSRGETRQASKATVKRLAKNAASGQSVSKAKEVEEVLEHPLLDLLNNPNPGEPDGIGMSIHQLFDYTQAFQEIIGRSYWKLDFDGIGGTPSGIWILASQYVREICDPSSPRIIDRYEFGPGGADRYKPEEIVPFRMPDLNNVYLGGTSPLRAVIEKSRIHRKVDAATNALLDNGGMPSQMFIPKGSDDGYGIDEKIAERIRWKLKQMFMMAGRGGVMVAESPGQLVPLQIPQRDLADLEMLKMTKTDICNGFQVPHQLLEPNDANRAVMDVAMEMHGRYAGLPRCQRLEATINRFLIPRYDDSGRLFVAYDSPVPEDHDERREDHKVLISASAIKVDELRNQYDLPPLGGEAGEAMVKPAAPKMGGDTNGDGAKKKRLTVV